MLLRSVPRVLVGLLLCLGVLLTGCTSTNPSTSATGAATRPSTPGTGAATNPTTSGTRAATNPGVSAGAATAVPSWAGDLPTVPESRLPADARDTLALIDKGGPFPYSRDGVVFRNFERLLPAQPRGYYHEYTVRTPGERDRGARRIVTGQGGEFYYTDDHYKSFRAVLR